MRWCADNGWSGWIVSGISRRGEQPNPRTRIFKAILTTVLVISSN